MKILVVTNMYPTPDEPSFGTFVYDQVESLRQAGADVDVLFINGRANHWNYFRAFPRYWRQLRRGGYQVVHAHYVLTGVVARAQWGSKVVLTHHGCEVLGYPRWETWLARLITPLFDEVVYSSEEMRHALDDDDGWVIPCGVDLQTFAPGPRDAARAAVGLPTDKPLVLWAGEHWRPEKQFHLAQQAMERVQQTLPDAELVLLSGQAHETVPSYMSGCDALVLTSTLEGSPMVVKEAMACNLPVVSTRVGDVPEVIGNTPGCALADPDPDDLARKLIEILRQPTRTTGRARVAHLSQPEVARRLLHVYAHAGSCRRSRRRRRRTPRRSAPV